MLLEMSIPNECLQGNPAQSKVFWSLYKTNMICKSLKIDINQFIIPEIFRTLLLHPLCHMTIFSHRKIEKIEKTEILRFLRLVQSESVW